MSTIETTLDLDGVHTHQYARDTHGLYREACVALAERYGPEAPTVILTPTGGAAINLVLTSLMRHWKGPVHIVYSLEIAAGTLRCINVLSQAYRKIVLVHHVVDSAESLRTVVGVVRNKQVVLFAESCSNTTGVILPEKVCDIIAAASASYHVVVDNTALTSAQLNPYIEYEIPKTNLTVVASASKHYSGGETMGGFVVSHNRKLCDRVARLGQVRGNHVHPAACRAILGGLETVDDRVAASTKIAAAVLERVDELLPEDTKILHSSVYLSRRLGSPGKFGPAYADVFSVLIPLEDGHELDSAALRLMVAPLKSFRFAGSYGGKDCRIDSGSVISDHTCRLRVSVGFGAANIELLITELVGLVRAIGIPAPEELDVTEFGSDSEIVDAGDSE